MPLNSQYDGSQSPFEGDLTIMLRGIPVGAEVLSARVTITPANSAGPDAFEEVIDLTGAGSAWGAVTHRAGVFCEVDFLKRRTIVGVAGSQFNGASLQLDPGGAYLQIDEDGAVLAPGATPFAANGASVATPSLTGVRFKLTNNLAPAPLINQVRVRSAPQNLSLRIGDGPTFWTQTGALAGPAVSSDFAQMLQIYLDEIEAPEGPIDVPLVVHSDSIARLRLDIEIDYLETQSLVEGDLAEAKVEFDFSGSPTAAGSGLAVDVPQGMCVSAEGSSLRVLGAFEDSRIVFGPRGDVTDAVAKAFILPEEGLAQPLTLANVSRISAIDLLLASETVAAELQLDIRNDADGKPGPNSLLAAPRVFDIHRRADGAASWHNVALEQETELPGNARIWLVVQSRQGKARWSSAPSSEALGTLQQSQAQGLAWRQARSTLGETAPLAGWFRLRNEPAEFTMPLELRVGEGPHAQTLSLDKYAPIGRIDFQVDSRDLAATFNRYLERAEQENAVGAELIGNGDFEAWLRIGEQPNSPRLLDSGTIGAIAFSPDGRTLYELTSEVNADGRLTQYKVQLWDPICGGRILDPLPLGELSTSRIADAIGSAATTRTRQGELSVSLDARHIWALTPDSRLTLIDAARLAVSTGFFEPGARSVVSDGLRVFYTTAQGQIVETPHAALIRALAKSVEDPNGEFERPSESRPVGIPPLSDNESIVGLALSPDAKQLYFGHSRLTESGDGLTVTLRRFDLERRQEAGQAIVLSSGDGKPPISALSFAVTPDGERMMVADGRSPQIQVFHIAAAAQEDDRALSFNQSSPLVALAAPALAGHQVAAVSRTVVNDLPFLQLHSLALGRRSPQEWDVLAGDVEPVCMKEPFHVAAALGKLQEVPGPLSSISQPVQVRGGGRYQLEFWGIASADAARAQVIWKGDDCRPAGVEQHQEISIAASQPSLSSRQATPTELQLHRVTLAAPADATQAELRFLAPEGVRAIVDNVSFRGTAEALQNADLREFDSGELKGWSVQSALPNAVVRENGRTKVTNVGEQIIAVTQVVPVEPNTRMTLHWDGRVETLADEKEQASLEVHWANASAPVTLKLSPLSAGPAVTTLVTPEGVNEAEIALFVPGGVSLSVEQVSLKTAVATKTPLTPIAQTPGRLTLLNPRIALKPRPPAPRQPDPRKPACPPTPPELEPGEMPGDCSFCPVCQKKVRAKPAAPAAATVGRIHQVAICPTCKSRLAPAGTINSPRELALVQRLPLSRRGLPSIPEERNLRALAVIATASIHQLARVSGIAEARARKLYAAGIRDLPALAIADPHRVLEATRGVGVDREAVDGWIEQAKLLTRSVG